MRKVTFNGLECCPAVPARPFGKSSPGFEVELWKNDDGTLIKYVIWDISCFIPVTPVLVAKGQFANTQTEIEMKRDGLA